MSYKRTSAGLVAVTVVATVVAGCSGSSSGTHSGTGSAAPAQAAPAQPTPAPTESNPPGDIPDNQVFVAYRPTGGFTGFTVKVPEGWARTDKGGTTVFKDKLNSVIATANASTPPDRHLRQGHGRTSTARAGGEVRIAEGVAGHP